MSSFKVDCWSCIYILYRPDAHADAQAIVSRQHHQVHVDSASSTRLSTWNCLYLLHGATCCGPVLLGTWHQHCRLISPAHMALSRITTACSSCGRMMGQTDGQTPDHNKDPVPHTTELTSQLGQLSLASLRGCLTEYQLPLG